MTESNPADERRNVEQFVICLGELRKPLDPGSSITIGKEDRCDLRLGHGTVSPVHCRLEVTDDYVVVHDLNSLCGTKIDDEPVMDGPWRPGQVLQVGDIRIELQTRKVVATPLAVAAGSGASTGANAGELLVHRHDVTFGEIMFAELKRTPWFALSVVVHGLALLLLWVFLERPVPLGSHGKTFSLEETRDEEEIPDDEIEEETEVVEEMQDTEFTETEVEAVEEQLFIDETDVQDYDSGLGDTSGLLTNLRTSGLNDILKEGKNALSGKFKKTVAGLRKNGLEIVFVFDSTGSMGSVLQAAKDRMAKMATVLLELVPYARIGVITYRDQGESEDYLIRQVALSRDFYRSINFLQMVYAGGGGDEPEAVYEALHAAITQKWGPTARRLVILIGDAPPHKHSAGKIASMVKSFARNGKSEVHAIITKPSGSGGIAKETEQTFTRIARDGRGEALAFDDEGKILKAVMNLAFGRKESRSIDEVYRLAELRGKKTTSSSQRLAEGKSEKRLRLEFQKSVVSHDLIKAILLKPKPAVLHQLVDFASSDSFSNAGKHAASYILQQVLHLDRPPVDPQTSQPLSRRRARTLKAYISRQFKDG